METTIILLQHESGDQYTNDQIVSAFSVFQNKITVKMFPVMKSGNAKDLWIMKEITKVARGSDVLSALC
jgi:hypothetical protein